MNFQYLTRGIWRPLPRGHAVQVPWHRRMDVEQGISFHGENGAVKVHAERLEGGAQCQSVLAGR